MLKVLDTHKLENGLYQESPNVGGPIEPRVIVMHYTATWDDAGAIRTLTDGMRENRVSAHVVVGLDGKITQLVPFKTKAWHAGNSHLDLPGGQRLVGLNSHSIGVEIVNPGWMRRNEAGEFFDSTGRNVTARLAPFGSPILAPWDRVGPGALYWPLYPEAQLDAIEALTRGLLAAYPGIEAIVGHSDITTRKSDPGPAFPMARFTRLLRERAEEGDDVVVSPIPAPAPLPQQPAPAPGEMRPAPTQPAPGDFQSPAPQPPLSRSRTIWGAIVAFFTGIIVFLRELFTNGMSWYADVRAQLQAQLGFDPIWILAILFVFAIALIIYARLDDRAKRKR